LHIFQSDGLTSSGSKNGFPCRRFENYASKLHASLGTLSLGPKLKRLGSKTGFSCILFKATAQTAPEGKIGFLCPRFENYTSNLHASLGTFSLGPKLKHLWFKTSFYCIFFKATA
jgi:hypothetical protein